MEIAALKLADDYDALKSDLARVTAERDTSKRREDEMRGKLLKESEGSCALRSRNAELEQSKRTVDFLCELHGCCPEMVLHWCEFEHRQLARAAELEEDGENGRLAYNLLREDKATAEQRNAELVEQLKAYGKYAHDTTLEDQNAELEAALREIVECVDVDGADEKYDREIQRICAIALARAESATPAKHPDTERLDWLEDLFSITAENGATWRNFMTSVHERGFRAAIDAARKQEASK